MLSVVADDLADELRLLRKEAQELTLIFHKIANSTKAKN
jgi:hypothetical protein